MSAEGRLDFARHDIDPATRVDRHRTRHWATQDESFEKLRAAGFAVLDVQLHEGQEGHGMGSGLTTYAQAR